MFASTERLVPRVVVYALKSLAGSRVGAFRLEFHAHAPLGWGNRPAGAVRSCAKPWLSVCISRISRCQSLLLAMVG